MRNAFVLAFVMVAWTTMSVTARTITPAFVVGRFDQLMQLKFSKRSSLNKASLCMKGSATTDVRVFLVRHGAVDLNSPGMVYPKDCFYGGQNVPLSTLGKVEAQVRNQNGYISRFAQFTFGNGHLMSRPLLISWKKSPSTSYSQAHYREPCTEPNA